MRKLVISTAALLALAACSSGPAPLAYTCGGYQVSVDTVADKATVKKPAGDIVLPRATAATGTRYADSSKGRKWPIFWNKADGATLWVNKKAYDCKAGN